MANLCKGSRVVYKGTSDLEVRWGANDDPRGVCVEGREYTVEAVEMLRFHSKVTLEGVEGRFNSVSFEKVRGKKQRSYK